MGPGTRERNAELAKWRRMAFLRHAAAVLNDQPAAQWRWRDVALADAARLRRLLARQELWLGHAGPAVSARIRLRPAPPVFRTRDIPGDPVSNAQWYRAMSVLWGHLQAADAPPRVPQAVLGWASRRAHLLYRDLGGAAGARRGLCPLAGFALARPAHFADPESGEAGASFLCWLDALRGRSWLRLPTGRHPWAWEGVALPGSSALPRAPLADLHSSGVHIEHCRTTGQVLALCDRLRCGDADWFSLAALGLGAVYGLRILLRRSVLVLYDAPVEGWSVEAHLGPGGSEVSPFDARVVNEWLVASRHRPREDGK